MSARSRRPRPSRERCGTGIGAGLGLALALLDDPVALLTRGLGRPWPLSYWSTYAIFAAIGFLLATWHWLRAMHEHYVAEGLNAGRRPFPALRA